MKSLNSILAVPYGILKRCFFYILAYRIHISAIFFFLLYYNNKRLTTNPLDYPLIISFAFWHFALYLFDRVYDGDLDKESQPNEYVPKKQRKALYIFIAGLVISSFFLYVKTGHPIVYWIILLPITFLYTLPIIGKTRIKNILIVKNVYSAGPIWTLPLYIQAVLVTGDPSKIPTDVLYSIFSLAIYILIGEIFWDIRDKSVDKKYGIATIPNTFGINTAKIIIFLLIVVDFSIKGQIDFNGSGILYCCLLPFTQEKSNRILFHLPPLIALLRFCI